MHRFHFGATAITSAGYDAQKALLEIEFARDGEVWQYMGVPEELWYRLKRAAHPDLFFQRHIKGSFRERKKKYIEKSTQKGI